jgi:BirA family biotin operon repressor/biotin-[acetyl-CoA-carboxylase] ligase
MVTVTPVSHSAAPRDSEQVAASRRPIDRRSVQALLTGDGGGGTGRWRVEQADVTGSTNADVAAAAPGTASGLVLTAEEQLTGRGRAGRDWSCPAGAGLMFSVLLRVPEIPAERRGWTGSVLGLAIVAAMARVGGVTATLKWPNDVLIGGAKCAGILGEVADDALVVGAGINVSLTADELPRADATSLLLAGGGSGRLDREALLAAILDELAELLDRWAAAAGDIDASGLRDRYRRTCSTIGSRVRLTLPDGATLVGEAVDVAADGSLLVQDGTGRHRAYTAADVVHLRPER